MALNSLYCADVPAVKQLLTHSLTLYAVMCDQMNAANGPLVENERLLWLGTAHDTVSIICKRGFSRSYCGKNATAWGKGVYFARDFAMSAMNIYSPADGLNQKYVYQCRVLTRIQAAGYP